jgi:hypothetical protein
MYSLARLEHGTFHNHKILVHFLQIALHDAENNSSFARTDYRSNPSINTTPPAHRIGRHLLNFCPPDLRNDSVQWQWSLWPWLDGSVGKSEIAARLKEEQ